MKSTKEYLSLLKQFKEENSARYGITRLGIFGSVARGEQKTHSDLDICVEMESPDIYKMVHLKEDLQEKMGAGVDIIRLRDTMDLYLRKRIDKEGLYV
jgi:predicted nucleotidyltransferase